MKPIQATARIPGFRFGAAAVLAGSIFLSAPAARAAVGASTGALFTPADPSGAILSLLSMPAGPALGLAPGLVGTDPDVAIPGADAPRCVPALAALEQMDRVISERVAQSRDSFIAAQAGRDLRVLEASFGLQASFRVASAD